MSSGPHASRARTHPGHRRGSAPIAGARPAGLVCLPRLALEQPSSSGAPGAPARRRLRAACRNLVRNSAESRVTASLERWGRGHERVSGGRRARAAGLQPASCFGKSQERRVCGNSGRACENSAACVRGRARDYSLSPCRGEGLQSATRHIHASSLYR